MKLKRLLCITRVLEALVALLMRLLLAVWLLAQWGDIGRVDTSTNGLYWQCGY